VLGAAAGISGAIFSGWLSTRIGTWNTYVIVGWSMITVMLGFVVAPRTANYFLGIELIYRTLASGGTVALLGSRPGRDQGDVVGGCRTRRCRIRSAAGCVSIVKVSVRGAW